MLEGLCLGELRAPPPVSTGLVAETGLVSADSWLKERDPDLFYSVSFPCIGLGRRWCKLRNQVLIDTWNHG